MALVIGCSGFAEGFGYLTEKDLETFATVDLSVELVSSSRFKAVIHGEGGNFSGDMIKYVRTMRHIGPAVPPSNSFTLRC